MKLPFQTLPAHRFSQPHSRFFDADYGLRVYSTPIALVGLRPSKLNCRTIENCFQSPCSFVVACLTWIPSIFQCALPLTSPQRIIRTSDDLEIWPTDFREETGFHLRLQPTLKLCSRPEAPTFNYRFHPITDVATFLALHLLQDNHRLPWFPSPFCGFDHYRVLLQPAQDTEVNRRPNPHEVFTFCPELRLWFRGYRGY
jgi:hypothetical protein